VGESYTDGTGTDTSSSGKPPFFRDIKIYGFDQHTFAEYVLINPIIKTWEHDTYDYSEDGGTMRNRMMIEYETVKYYSGAVGSSRPDTNVVGFADPNYYDQNHGSVISPNGRSTVSSGGSQVEVGIGNRKDSQAGTLASPVGAPQQALNNISASVVLPGNRSVQEFTLETIGEANLPPAGQIIPSPNQTGNDALYFPTRPGTNF
jgi:hypothetical protein